MNTPLPSREKLVELVNYRMPFGKYKDRLLIDLPEPYVVWFSQKGFPKGKLGDLLQTVYVIKVNGLEDMLRPLKRTGGKGPPPEAGSYRG